MSKKFTKEQYQKIINIWNSSQDFDDTILSVSDYARKLNARLNYEYAYNVYDYGEAILLALPNSREWAHEQYVEKEKKYVWSSKKADRDNNVLTLYIDNYGMVSTSYRKVYEKNLRNEDMLLTETEIKAWGYNPEMFDKEEVD